MPSVESFLYIYDVPSGVPPGSLSISFIGPTGTTLSENAGDGDGINGSTAPGTVIDETAGNLAALGFTPPYSLLAVTDAGDPIITNGSGGRVVLSNDPALGATVTVTDANLPYVYCFATGTMIAVEHGEREIEALKIGDQVLAASGDLVPIKWVGRQIVYSLFAGPHMQPVRIRAGALGNDLPHTDLTITADHGIILDGLVINASALVNDATIDFVPLSELPDQITYYHIETDAHDVIVANGAPAETFMDAAGRKAFDNHPEYLDLYGAERLIPEMPRPRITAQRLVPDAIKARLGIAIEVADFGDLKTA